MDSLAHFLPVILFCLWTQGFPLLSPASQLSLLVFRITFCWYILYAYTNHEKQKVGSLLPTWDWETHMADTRSEDAFTTYNPVTIFFPFGVRLHLLQGLLLQQVQWLSGKSTWVVCTRFQVCLFLPLLLLPPLFPFPSSPPALRHLGLWPAFSTTLGWWVSGSPSRNCSFR